MADLKIDTTLTDEEQSLLCLMLGYGTGMVVSEMDPQLGKTCVRIVNKLMLLNPDFLPYDENRFDPSKPSPFIVQPPQ